MEIYKEYIVEDTFVSSVNISNNYYNELCSVCGRGKDEEYRALVKFDLNTIYNYIKNGKKINKVELCLYLAELKIEKHEAKYMLNLGVNISDYNPKEVTYDSSPEFSQESCMYVLKPEYKKQYINFDISRVVEKWIDKKIDNYGITLIGINKNGFAFFSDSRSENKSYLRIICDDENHKNDSNAECSRNNTRLDCKYYGYFINNTGKFVKKDRYDIILWNKGYNVKGMFIGNQCSDIIIEQIGIYQIDYGVNIRSNEKTCMAIVINGVEIPYSRIQIGCSEQMSCGNILLEVRKKCSRIHLIIKKTNMILCNTGISAMMRIIKL